MDEYQGVLLGVLWVFLLLVVFLWVFLLFHLFSSCGLVVLSCCVVSPNISSLVSSNSLLYSSVLEYGATSDAVFLEMYPDITP